jgi:hypothetical protein
VDGSSDTKMTFFFDHADIAQRMLIALDTDHLLLKLPQLASRLVFQLWEINQDFDNILEVEEEVVRQGIDSEEVLHSQQRPSKSSRALTAKKNYHGKIDKRMSTTQVRDAVSNQPVAGAQKSSGPPSIEHAKAGYVRVLYKGYDITNELPLCRQEMSRRIVTRKLCSLPTFSKQIESLIAPFENFEKACG